MAAEAVGLVVNERPSRNVVTSERNGRAMSEELPAKPPTGIEEFTRIHSDPETMSGVPVFIGSRLPVQTLLDCLNSGADWDRLVASWPFLTEEHVIEARRWEATSPPSRKGSGRRA